MERDPVIQRHEDEDRPLADNRKCRYSGTRFKGEKGESEGFVRVCKKEKRGLEGLIYSNGEVGTRFSFKKESLRNWWIVLYKLRAKIYQDL